MCTEPTRDEAIRHEATPQACAQGVEFRLVVWLSPGRTWRARVTGGDAVEHEFASPFELARFVAWPLPATSRDGGLR